MSGVFLHVAGVQLGCTSTMQSCSHHCI